LKRVLIVSGGSMLSSGVEHLIKTDGAFILRCIFNPKKEELEQEILTFGPDVMIIEQSTMAGEAVLMQALKSRRKWCIILLDYQDNLLHVFAREEVRIFETQDLIEILRRGFGVLGNPDHLPAGGRLPAASILHENQPAQAE